MCVDSSDNAYIPYGTIVGRIAQDGEASDYFELQGNGYITVATMAMDNLDNLYLLTQFNERDTPHRMEIQTLSPSKEYQTVCNAVYVPGALYMDIDNSGNVFYTHTNGFDGALPAIYKNDSNMPLAVLPDGYSELPSDIAVDGTGNNIYIKDWGSTIMRLSWE
jgi:hypothetical protein